MTKVSIVALGSVRDRLGWDVNAREFELADADATVGDVLKAVPTEQGGTLFEFLTDAGNLRAEYMVRVNGGCVRRKAGLDTGVSDGDTLLAMDIVRFIAGG